MLEQLQHVPVVDEQILLAGYEFQIKSMEGRRILQVCATPLAEESGTPQIGY
ncbi:MAG TPA: transporter associated domain-containing protein [Cellvibrio sp.]